MSTKAIARGMMEPLTLKEFADLLRIRGDYREVEFADEILELLTLEEEVAEPYSELCDDIAHRAPDGLKEKPAKALEWLIDRSDMLGEIEAALTDAGREPRDTDDATDVVKELVETLGEVDDLLEAQGWPIDGDVMEGLYSLAERPAPLEYDL